MAHETTVKNPVGGGGTASLAKTRDSNIELLRIIAMVLIVAHHYVVNSGLTIAEGPIFANPLSWRSLFLLMFGAWGKICINCFVLITGYFMCTSHITAKKFAKLLFEVMFYRIAINAVFWITGYYQLSLTELIKMLIPLKSVDTDFTSAYLVFYLFIPFLNIIVQNMKEKQHLLLLVWCGFTYIFLGTVPGFSVTMNYVSWFSVLYVIASYIRLYPKKFYEETRLWGWLSVGSVLLSTLSVVACTWLGTKIGRNISYSFVADSNTFLAVVTGVCTFMFFKNWKIGISKFINTVAASTFGVFQIHANSDTMRQWLWKDVLDSVGHYGSHLMPLYAIGSVLTVFIICTIIDQLRIRFIEKPFFKLWDRHWNSVKEKYNRLETKITSMLGISK